MTFSYALAQKRKNQFYIFLIIYKKNIKVKNYK